MSSKPIKGARFRKKLSFGKYSPRGKTEFFVCLLDNNMDLPKQLGDLDCSMFEPPAKRSRPSPLVLSQTVPKGFMKAYTHAPDEEMDTVSFFARIFPALVALLTGELSFHQYKVSLVLKVEMTKAQGDGKRKVQQPYFLTLSRASMGKSTVYGRWGLRHLNFVFICRMATRLRMKLRIELFFTVIKSFWGVHVQVLAEIFAQR